MSFCSKCGAQLAPDARFCPRCGTPAPAETPAVTAEPPAPAITAPPPVIPPPVIPPRAEPAPPPAARPSPPNYTPVQPAKRSTWWIVPLVIIGLVVLAAALLMILPLNRDDDESAESAPATETIAEGTTTAQGQPMTGTLIEVPGVDEPATTETSAPPLQDTTATMAPISPAPVPEPRVIEEPPRQPQPSQPRPVPPPTQTTRPPAPAPRPATPAPRPPTPAPRPSTPAPAPAPREEISEVDASSTLRGFISSRSYYDGVSSSCLSIRGHGYRNVGYTFSVWDSCVSGGGSRMLGRWRVDSKTREVFRQREDGRFLRP
jgi:hypothetical protein